MEVYPLKSFHELLFWIKPDKLKPILDKIKPLQYKSSPVQLPSLNAPEIPFRTLVCHDMKGGYLDDRFCYGTSNDEAYKFYQWSGVDIFVYFSHCFITIPPIGWIQTAHNHGVKVLGTVITEWNDGATVWEELLQDENIMETAINNLVLIAETYKFEGWLLNIENKINPKQINRLIKFVKELSLRMRMINTDSEVIWYDSVTCEGHLCWQNELNDLNKCFFDVCTGIFLNYTWNEDNLIQSVQAAKERYLSIYVGLDVFGRNFYGGGGYNLNKALKLIRKYRLSAAIFAPGWTYQILGKQLFFANENRLWRSLTPYLLFHGPTKLPFSTSFCQGSGKQMYKDGEVLNAAPWYNIFLQHIQPSLWEKSSSIMTEDAYCGGSCISFWMDKRVFIRLLVCEIAITHTLEFTFVYKVSGSVKHLWFEILIQTNKESNPKEWKKFCFVCEKHEKGDDLTENSIVAVSKWEKNSWTCRKFDFMREDLLNTTIRDISLCGVGPGVVFFGNMSIV